jgi:hypothetical protein
MKQASSGLAGLLPSISVSPRSSETGWENIIFRISIPAGDVGVIRGVLRGISVSFLLIMFSLLFAQGFPNCIKRLDTKLLFQGAKFGVSVDVDKFWIFWFQVLNEGIPSLFVDSSVFDPFSAIKTFGVMFHIFML